MTPAMAQMGDASRRHDAFVQYATELVLGPFAGVAAVGQQDWAWDACKLDTAAVARLAAPATKFAEAFALSHG
jgi:hypothetical protein